MPKEQDQVMVWARLCQLFVPALVRQSYSFVAFQGNTFRGRLFNGTGVCEEIVGRLQEETEEVEEHVPGVGRRCMLGRPANERYQSHDLLLCIGGASEEPYQDSLEEPAHRSRTCIRFGFLIHGAQIVWTLERDVQIEIR